MVDTGGRRQGEEWASRMAVCGGGGTCSGAGTAGEASGSQAVLELSGNQVGYGAALDCASTDRSYLLMAVLLVLSTPKIMNKNKKYMLIYTRVSVLS